MVEKIAQIVDSSGNLPREILKKFKIKEVPFYYTFDGEKHYRENVDFSTIDFYRQMENNHNTVPKTSAPNINDWLSVFKELYSAGYRKFIVTTISSHLSSSFQNVILARQAYLKSQKDTQIEIIPTNNCAAGQAALEIKIAHMINEGLLSFEKIIAQAKRLVPNITTLFSVHNLVYMKAGGRIGGATAFLGQIINIKPICEFVNGVVKPIKAVRGRKKSLTALVDIVQSRVNNINNTIIFTQNAICEEDESYLIDYLRKKLNYTGTIYRNIISATIGAHSGPGSIGIGFLEGEEL